MQLIVYGPQGCGKSTNAERIRDYFALDRIIDGYPFEGISDPNGSFLVLTDLTHDQLDALPETAGMRKLRFDECMKRMKQ